VMACGRTEACLAPTLYVRRGLAVAGLIFGIAAAAAAAPGAASDDPVKVKVAAKVADGYARLVFDLSEYVDASARLGNNILIITFERPVDVNVDRLAAQIPDYVGAARRDPD